MPVQGKYSRIRRSQVIVPDAPKIYRVEGTGPDAIDDAIAAAIADRGMTMDGDVFVTEDTAYDNVLVVPKYGAHQVPFALGVPDRTECTGFVSVNPVAAGLDDWSYGAQSGSPTYAIVGEQLVMTADAGSEKAEIRWAPGQLNRPYQLVIDGLEATGNTQSVVITLFTGNQTGRYLSIRNQSNTWEIRTSGGAWSGMGGRSTLTPSRLELRYQPTGPHILYRWGSTGIWTPVTGYTVAYSTTTVFTFNVAYVSGTAVGKVKSVFVGPTY